MSTVMARQIAASGGCCCGCVLHRPAQRDLVAFDAERPLPAAFAPVTGVGAGSFTTVGGFVQRPVDGDLGQVESDDPVERGERFGGVGGNTPAAIHSSRRARSVVSETRVRGLLRCRPTRPRGEADQHPPEHQPVGHPWPVQPKRVDWGLGQERLDRRIHGVYNLAFECAHDGGDLPGRRLWIALGMKTEPTRRPADGHLSARVLSSLLASLTTSRGESVRWLPS